VTARPPLGTTDGLQRPQAQPQVQALLWQKGCCPRSSNAKACVSQTVRSPKKQKLRARQKGKGNIFGKKKNVTHIFRSKPSFVCPLESLQK
jgi:hypothetical protein